MSARAGIIVTGTEVLSGQVADRNGPWVAARLLEMGVDVAHVLICGDRPADLAAQLRFLGEAGVDLIVTTGGLGPTADDLTVATVADARGLPLSLDPELEERIATIIRDWRGLDPSAAFSDAMAAGIAKQAHVPAGAEPIEPTGTAPGVAIAGDGRRPAVLILPGPPGELRRMWPQALSTRAVHEALAGREDLQHDTIRAYGLSEADLAETLREAETSVDGFDSLEITTCMRDGEVEIDTRYPAAAATAEQSLVTLLTDRHGDRFFSTDGATLDDMLARVLARRTVATAESCTGGMVAARLTDRAGSSAYVLGGVVSYANEVKTGVLGVPPALIAELGAVSEPVAGAMAEGARARTGADIAVSTSGIAGPGGAVPGKPVGTVCFGLAVDGRDTVTVTRRFPGDRDTVRRLATTYALHLVLEAAQDS
ncbi:MAG: competence/damage-inducible protein A [Gordonia sp. (in: high G+C Gram-positive bacteria)]|uniref:competence/damage-inducible protein A n=1 Tax=Gordonia sp. (in: high G+C Gram-positive bacteria) TaxID=84139 RepID=UPI0039E4FE38